PAEGVPHGTTGIAADHGWMYCGHGAYVQLSEPFNYSCNGEYVDSGNMTAVDVEFEFHASVAQWVQLKVNATRIDWKVIKPGEYLAPPIFFEYKSNGNLIFESEGFGDMTGEDGDVIETYFAYKFLGTSDGWIRAADFNRQPFSRSVPEDECHNWNTLKLVQKIIVGDCVSACEYEAGGTIQVILAEQKPWLAHILGLV
ncbi:unnamed protein product, partial [marine sediment metagenome]